MKKIFTVLIIAFCLNGNAQIITTVAGNGVIGFTGDGGQATSAELYVPYGVALDAIGNLYIADINNNRIRKVSTTGIINTVAGNGTGGFSGDGGQATNAELYYPCGVAIDMSGNLYIADAANSCIRMVNTSGIITTVAGNGLAGFSGDGGQANAAQLNYPYSIAFDNYSNLYIADYFNYRIRKVNTSGIISTIAGNGTQGFSGDGGLATAAEFNNPFAIALDTAGNLFVSDQYNNRIRKINTMGIITTVVGNGSQGFSGDGGQATSAKLDTVTGITIDKACNIYISDNHNQRIRQVNTSGIITTVVGNGTRGFSGDLGLATAAKINSPLGIAIDTAGNLFIADAGNDRIRKVTNVTGIQVTTLNNTHVNIFPNPTTEKTTINSSEKISNIKITNVLGEQVYFSQINSTSAEINLGNLPNGNYFMQLYSENSVATKKIIVQR